MYYTENQNFFKLREIHVCKVLIKEVPAFIFYVYFIVTARTKPKFIM